MEAQKRRNQLLRAVWNKTYGKIPIYPKNRLRIPLHKALSRFVRVVNDRVMVDVTPFTDREKEYLLRVVANLGYRASWTEYQF